MKKVVKFLVVIIISFILFDSRICAKEITIDDYIEKLQSYIDDFAISNVKLFQHEYRVYKSEAEEDDSENKVIIEKVEEEGKTILEDEKELISFFYDDDEKYIMFNDVQLDPEDEYYSDKVLVLVCSMLVPADLYGYTSKTFIEDYNQTDFTYEKDGIEYETETITSGNTEITYPKYLKMSYGEKIKNFWDKLTKEKETEEEDNTTTKKINSTNMTTDPSKNPPTKKDGKGLIITVIIFILVSIILIAKERINILNKKIKS